MLKLLLILLPLFTWAQGEKRIIGADDRYQIKSHRDPFYKAVGLLQTHYGTGICTGTLISPKLIITNAHCVVESSKKFPAKLMPPASYTFVPGFLSRGSAPFGTYKVRRVDTFRRYVETGDMAYDVAVLHLTEAVRLPFVNVRRISDERVIENRLLYITGYPGDKAYGTLWESRGKIHDAVFGLNRIVHDADTIPGQSGSIIRAKFGTTWQAVGVHRGSTNDDNIGVLFTPEVFDAIQRWRKN